MLGTRRMLHGYLCGTTGVTPRSCIDIATCGSYGGYVYLTEKVCVSDCYTYPKLSDGTALLYYFDDTNFKCIMWQNCYSWSGFYAYHTTHECVEGTAIRSLLLNLLIQ